jgi:hypothetical protein
VHPFALSRADDPAKAIAAHLQDPQLAFIASGTDLIGLMKDRAALPECLLDINGLPDMARIEALTDGGLRIGALARMSDVAADPEVRRRFPARPGPVEAQPRPRHCPNECPPAASQGRRDPARAGPLGETHPLAPRVMHQEGPRSSRNRCGDSISAAD